MEKIKTEGFSAKDEFNAANSTPIKVAKNSVITITDIMVKDKMADDDGKVETVGYLKAEDGTIYATISATVIEQLIPLMDILKEGPQNLLVVPKTSGAGREYFMLELQ
jgi:hypothetical protein